MTSVTVGGDDNPGEQAAQSAGRGMMKRALRSLTRAVMESRAPDFVIGADHPDGPYMRRWWLIPRNPIFNVYLHEFLRSDDDRALHDHPWWSLSIMVRGFLLEQHAKGRRSIKNGAITFRRAAFSHRIEVPRSLAMEGFYPVTIFLTGPRIREWGFWCPKGWVHWKQFTAPLDKGAVGRGCE